MRVLTRDDLFNQIEGQVRFLESKEKSWLKRMLSFMGEADFFVLDSYLNYFEGLELRNKKQELHFISRFLQPLGVSLTYFELRYYGKQVRSEERKKLCGKSVLVAVSNKLQGKDKILFYLLLASGRRQVDVSRFWLGDIRMMGDTCFVQLPRDKISATPVNFTFKNF